MIEWQHCTALLKKGAAGFETGTSRCADESSTSELYPTGLLNLKKVIIQSTDSLSRFEANKVR